jgi:hypothetical protein
LSIHGAGKEGHLNEDDLELKNTFTLKKAAMHTATMNSLALEEVAATHRTISCVHIWPGFVITPAYGTIVRKLAPAIESFTPWVVLPLACQSAGSVISSMQPLLVSHQRE